MSVTIRVTSLMLRSTGGGLLLRFGLVEFGQLGFPFRGFLRLTRGFVELHEALKGFRENLIAVANLILALPHAFVAGNEQRFSFGKLLLPQQSVAQHGAGVERVPFVWHFLFTDGQALAVQRFRLGELALSS